MAGLADYIYGMMGKGFDAGSAGATQSMGAQDKLAQLIKTKQLAGETQKENLKLVQDTMAQNPDLQKQGVKIGDVSVNAAQIDPYKELNYNAKIESKKSDLITKMKKDYDNLSKGSSDRVRIGAQLADAIQNNNSMTQGQMKAMIPRLESEMGKVSDKERELMINPTLEGTVARMKNWWGGDAAAVSESQKQAATQTIQQMVAREKANLARNRDEITRRYGAGLSMLPPEHREAVINSFGSGMDDLGTHVQGMAPPPEQSIAQNVKSGMPHTGPVLSQTSQTPGGAAKEPAPGTPERLQWLRAKHKGQ
jgi:hypothetical protein